jgi:hypothetical protein
MIKENLHKANILNDRISNIENLIQFLVNDENCDDLTISLNFSSKNVANYYECYIENVSLKKNLKIEIIDFYHLHLIVLKTEFESL